MLASEIKKYQLLNELAEQGGTVILGGTDDKEIPLCELKQAFSWDCNYYNRSIVDLSVNKAIEVYDACVAPLNPDTIFLHIGAADIENFEKDASTFDQKYREFINHIRTLNKKCTIVIISLRNYTEVTSIAEINKHLKYIAESERCEYGDVSVKRVWNPKEAKSIMSFIYSTGFIRPLKIKQPIYDLVKILF